MEFNGRLDVIYWNNSLREYILALGLFVMILVILWIIKTFIIKKIEKLSKKTKTKADDHFVKAINTIGWPFYFILALNFCIKPLILPEFIVKGIKWVTVIVVAFYIILGIQKVIVFSIRKIVESKNNELDEATGQVLGKVLTVILWIVAIIMLLSNLGYNITTLITGLGIGGIAIAFALQNILGDIFSSFSIYLDRPFKVGDFIVIGEDYGTVKKIGIKSTRIKTLRGEELIVSNRELTSVRVHNYKVMKKRRVAFNIGVEYGTSVKKLEAIPKIVKKIIGKVKGTEFSRTHFKEFADFSLIFEIVYFMDTKDYVAYMDAREKINLGIAKEFKKARISMAFPTQTVFVKK